MLLAPYAFVIGCIDGESQLTLQSDGIPRKYSTKVFSVVCFGNLELCSRCEAQRLCDCNILHSDDGCPDYFY